MSQPDGKRRPPRSPDNASKPLLVSLPLDLFQTLVAHLSGQRHRSLTESEVIHELLERALKDPDVRDRVVAEQLLRTKLAESPGSTRSDRTRAVS
jgi:hypothetical protein